MRLTLMFVGLIGLFFTLDACTDSGGEEENTLPDPILSGIAALQLGANDYNPHGDGSGRIEVQVNAEHAARFEFDLGDGSIRESESARVDHTYEREGVHSYPIRVTAFSSSGESVSQTVHVTVYRSNDPFPTLVWADEFDGQGALENEKWHHQVFPPNNGGWFNGEFQHYTDRTENSFVSNGTLKIVALKETYATEGSTRSYTSARLNSRFAFTYGRVVVRAKLPSEAGTWPAIWTLGANINEAGNVFGTQYGSVGWPACGEIDLLEQRGWDKNTSIAHFHWGHTQTGIYAHSGGEISNPDATTAFHDYILVWDENSLKVYVDEDLVHELENTADKPYDNPHYLLLNIAMGGNLGGTIPPDFSSATMEVDYVRVFQ